MLIVEELSLYIFQKKQWVPLVEHINLHLPRSTTLALLGPSGSGKTLTALSIIGLLPQGVQRTNGHIWFQLPDGASVDLTALSADQLRKLRGKHIGFVFQEPLTALNPVMRCGQQIMEVLRTHQRQTRQQAREGTLELLQRVGLTDAQRFADSYPHQLSGGQRQRVMIAMALACTPSLLICDEPTTALDVTTQVEICALLRKLQAELNLSILFISHDFFVVEQLADQIAILCQGQVVEVGPTEQIVNTPQHPLTRALLEANNAFSLRPKGLKAVGSAPGGEPAYQSKLSDPEGNNSSSPLLQVEHLTVAYPRAFFHSMLGRPTIRAVHDATFSVREGEIVGITGASGSGKTSLAKAIVGLTDHVEGTIRYRQQVLAEMHPQQKRAFRREVQMVFQDPYASLNPRMRIRTQLLEAMEWQSMQNNTYQHLQAIDALLEQVQLEQAVADRFPHQLSAGQRQRVVLARALACRPRIIICDECFSALDLEVQYQVCTLLQQLYQEAGLTYLIISHDLKVLRTLCHRILVMHQGRVVEDALAEDFFTAPRHYYAQQLVAACSGIWSGVRMRD